jgi:hypothetical protein
MSSIIPPYLRLIPGGNTVNLPRGHRQPVNSAATGPENSKTISVLNKTSFTQPITVKEAETYLHKLLNTDHSLPLGDIHTHVNYHNALKLLL